ncbi:MAG TPA: hypothetical protein VN875_02545 [Candidatus Binatus sp.]|jgi:hypothetical protein|nr:hypothetical protein [Candidatus Binatus sp.]
MRTCKHPVRSIFLTCALLCSFSAHAQTQPAAGESSPFSANPQSTSVNDLIDRIISREHAEIVTIRRFNPIIETYIQDMKLDKKMGSVPARDYYFLSQADLSPKGAETHSMLNRNRDGSDPLNPTSHQRSNFVPAYFADDFLQMIYIDPSGFDRQHYQFDYVRREFLGEVRCLVFDISPLPKSGKGRFKGRIWAEDQNLAIVRFNGVYLPVAGINGFNLHFDSWRLNVQPGLWLPAYIFSQESNQKDFLKNFLIDFLGGHVRFKSQTRLWNYSPRNVGRQEEFSELTVESPNTIEDQAVPQNRSPVDARREWQHQAEINVVDRLQRTGLLAPPGEVEKVLETVVNNLEVTNNLDVKPDVQCRVMLTGTLDMFSIGHTIVLSRGLIDVLPDEASLATMLAQELADIILTKSSTDQWGFNDVTTFTAVEAMSHFSFKETPEQVRLATQKALEFLKNSPYKDKLGSVGLFLKQLDADSKTLTALINPHLGNRVYLTSELMSSAPDLDPTKLDQISALPMGARVKLDPWTNQVALLKAKPTALLSANEKMPLEVTPFMPFLTLYKNPGRTVSLPPPQ